MVASEGVTFYEARRRVYLSHKLQTRQMARSYAEAAGGDGGGPSNGAGCSSQTRVPTESTRRGLDGNTQVMEPVMDARRLSTLEQKMDRLIDMVQLLINLFTVDKNANIFHRCTGQEMYQHNEGTTDVIGQVQDLGGDTGCTLQQNYEMVDDNSIHRHDQVEGDAQIQQEVEVTSPRGTDDTYNSTRDIDRVCHQLGSETYEEGYHFSIDPASIQLPEDDESTNYIAEVDSDDGNA